MNLNDDIQSRATLVASFLAASRVAEKLGHALILNAASAAGLLLYVSRTTQEASEACARMPADHPWPLAGRYIAAIADAESGDTQPAMSAVGGRR